MAPRHLPTCFGRLGREERRGRRLRSRWELVAGDALSYTKERVKRHLQSLYSVFSGFILRGSTGVALSQNFMFSSFLFFEFESVILRRFGILCPKVARVLVKFIYFYSMQGAGIFH